MRSDIELRDGYTYHPDGDVLKGSDRCQVILSMRIDDDPGRRERLAKIIGTKWAPKRDHFFVVYTNGDIVANNCKGCGYSIDDQEHVTVLPCDVHTYRTHHRRHGD